MNRFRRRLEHSRTIAAVLAFGLKTYLRLCQRTTKWQMHGLDALRADLADGPVLLVMWHERSAMGPVHWPLRDGQLSSLYASSPIGRVSGAMQRQFGLRPMEMSNAQGNVAASRTILKRVREGVSIGMTGDGPLGPALVVKDAPLDWARVIQRPVYGYAFATTKHVRLRTWDYMMMPKPFGRGAVVFQKWDSQPARKDTSDQHREDLRDLLDRATQTADDLIRAH